MSRANHRLFLWLMLAVVGANYLAQIPYYLHVYYIPRGAAPAWGGSLLLGATLAWFLAGYILLARGSRLGYWMVVSYLLVVVIFYARNMFTQVTHGFAPFFHLQTRDPILFAVFGIGYLNLIGGFCFLVYLAVRYRSFIGDQAKPAAPRALAG